MTKWNIFGKSKSKKIAPQNYPETAEPEFDTYTPVQEDEHLNFEEQPADQPMAEHHETLQSGKTSSKSSNSSSDQRVWRDVKNIEENIDSMNINSSITPNSEFEKKVDKLIKKKK